MVSSKHFVDRYFFVKSAIYLLVVNLKDPNFESTVLYWFNIILAQVSHPMVVLIGTHRDEVARDIKPVSLLESVGRKALALDKGCSISYFALDATNEEEVQNLSTLLQIVISKFPDFDRRIPMSHLFFEHALKSYADSMDYPILSRQTMLRVGELSGLGSKKAILSCTKFLHDVGSILYFDDMPALKDIVITDPFWLYGAITTIFSKDLDVSGIVDNQALARIFKRFDSKLHYHLKFLLIKFEIAFEIEGEIGAIEELLQHKDADTTPPATPIGSPTITFLRRGSVADPLKPSQSPLAQSERFISRLDFEDDTTLLVVNHLPTEAPSNLRRRWKYPPKEAAHLDRYIHFDFLPPGVFPSILSRAIPTVTKLTKLWQDGVLGTFSFCGSTASVLLTQVFVRFHGSAGRFDFDPIAVHVQFIPVFPYV